jgi:hypothetical protein
MARIPILLRVIKDDDYSTTNSMSVAGGRTTYSTKAEFSSIQYLTILNVLNKGFAHRLART